MTEQVLPFALPAQLDPALSGVADYWRGLIRGKASDMPYWDDVKLSDLGSGADSAMLMTVFDKPQRFRIEIAGKEISTRYGGTLQGTFTDEIDIHSPVEFLRAQASATAEGGAPTYYATDTYARLLLPLWGEGHVGMLLAGYSWA